MGQVLKLGWRHHSIFMKNIEQKIIDAEELKEQINDLTIEIDDEGITNLDQTVSRFVDFLYSKTKNDKTIEEIFTVLDSEEHSEPFFISKINFISICEHHLVPFFGTVDLGVIPDKKIAGLSKYGNLVEYYSNAFQIQERFTKQIGEKIQEILQPKGVFIRVVAQHLCSQVDSGVNNVSQFITTHTSGIYSMDASLRDEALKQFE